MMKFTVALIGLALAVAVNANGYDYHPHYQHQVVEVAKVHSPVGSHGPALVNIFGPNKNYDYSWGGSSGGSNDGGYGGVQSGGYGGYGSVGYSGDADHGHDGKYVAINRGAVHVSPLVGHVQSVKSINHQPAPGTNTW